MSIRGKYEPDGKARALLVKASRLVNGQRTLVKSSVQQVLKEKEIPAGIGYRSLRVYLERRLYEQILTQRR